MTARARIPALLLLVVGCALDHERGEGGVSPDAGHDAAVPRDGSLPRDGAVADVGRDATSPCLPPGSYPVTVRLEDQSPAGCIGTGIGMTTLNIPPRVEDFAGMCTEPRASVVDLGNCTWQIDVACNVIDAGSTTSGTITARDGAVRGRLDVALSSIAGVCTAVAVLGP